MCHFGNGSHCKFLNVYWTENDSGFTGLVLFNLFHMLPPPQIITGSTDEKFKSGYSWQSHRELSLHSAFVILQITSVPFSKLFWFWHPTCGCPTLGMSSFPLLAFTEPDYNHLPYRHEGWVRTKSATAIKKTCFCFPEPAAVFNIANEGFLHRLVHHLKTPPAPRTPRCTIAAHPCQLSTQCLIWCVMQPRRGVFSWPIRVWYHLF